MALIDVKQLTKTIAGLIKALTPRNRDIVSRRFGLKNGTRETLEAIGKSYGITRERVRQIEEHAVGKLAPRVREAAASLIDKATGHLKSLGGVRRNDEFMKDVENKFLARAVRFAPQKIAFLFLVSGAPLYERETDDTHDYWYSDEGKRKEFQNFVKQVVTFFKSSKKDDILVGKTHLKAFPDVASHHFLSVSKHFGVNSFGDFGLRSWAEIEPRTIRDKAYLVLKKHGKPLHFEDIAKFISSYGIDAKSAHVQTVHNELIKDNRFVLVGRGIYGLREHGFEPGTVREVISKLLKKNGPLSSDQVVKFVNEQRLLKENTILLSLQNRQNFKRLDDGRYHIREA